MKNKFWILSNEDSRSVFFRQNHQKLNGGEWKKTPKGWVWIKPAVEDNKIHEKSNRVDTKKQDEKVNLSTQSKRKKKYE